MENKRKYTVLKIVAIIFTVVSAIAILFQLGMWIWGWYNGMSIFSIGIIGGADGPTAIYIAGKSMTLIPLWAVMPVVAVVLWVIYAVLRRRKKQ